MKIHYIHIGKTGGTAIKHALKETAMFKQQQLVLHPHKTKLSDIPVGEKVFFSLREPISRFFSAFYSRQRKGMPRYHSEWNDDEKNAFEAFSTPIKMLDGACSPTKNELHKRAILAFQTIQHVKDHYNTWLVSSDYLKSRKSDILHVAFQERLSEDFKIIKEKLSLDTNINLPTSSKDAHKNPQYEIPKLTEIQIKFLRSWYADDYNILNYCKKNFSIDE